MPKVKLSLNQYETLMSQAADRMCEYQDVIARIKVAIAHGRGPTLIVSEIREILKPYS